MFTICAGPSGIAQGRVRYKVKCLAGTILRAASGATIRSSTVSPQHWCPVTPDRYASDTVTIYRLSVANLQRNCITFQPSANVFTKAFEVSTHVEMTDEHRPLLPSEAIHHAERFGDSAHARSRYQVKRFLTSKVGHYTVLAVVALDISSIFADLLLTSLACEGRVPVDDAEIASDALSIVWYRHT